MPAICREPTDSPLRRRPGGVSFRAFGHIRQLDRVLHQTLSRAWAVAPARATRRFDAAYPQARETAGDDSVDIAGGAWTVRQALAVGVLDELTLDIAPVLLGSGERIFDGVESLGMEPVEVLHSPLATHIRYRRAG